MAAKDGRSVIGLVPEQLTIVERFELAGKWVALEMYTPTTVKEEAPGRMEVELKQRFIRALGDSAEECIRQLRHLGLNPLHFEFLRLTRPY